LPAVRALKTVLLPTLGRHTIPTDRAMGVNAYPGDPRRGKLGPMRLYLVGLLVAAAACNSDEPPPLTPEQVLEGLRGLPGVHDVTEMSTLSAGYHYYVLRFEQNVDHNDPQSPTFLQKV